jgi:hypothetical protein
VTDYPWWHEVEATAPLTQGDLIEACPVAVFKADLIFEEAGDLGSLLTALRGGVGIQHVRSIVMTQACDLAEQKVRNAILCPAPKLEDFKKDWEEAFTLEKGRQPKPDEWKNYIKNIKAGRAWNFTLLRQREPGDGAQLTTPTTVVDFHEVFSLPVSFLTLWLRKGGSSTSAQTAIPEHLSQPSHGSSCGLVCRSTS